MSSELERFNDFHFREDTEREEDSMNLSQEVVNGLSFEPKTFTDKADIYRQRM